LVRRRRQRTGTSKEPVQLPPNAKRNGSSADPLYGELKKQAPGFLGTEGIKWNFTKFLVGRDGQVVERYAPTTKPEEIAADIEKLL